MTDTQKWQLLALTLLLGALLYWLSPILTPFAFSALLAYLGDPIVDRLEKLRISRTFAVILVFTGMVVAIAVVLLLVVPMLERQISHFIQQLPAYVTWFRDRALPWIAQRLGTDIGSLQSFEPQQIIALLQEHWRAAGGFAATVVARVSSSGFALIGWVANALMVPVVTFYLLRDWDLLVARVHELLPRPIEPTIRRLAREADEVLGAFLRGQLSVMLALGTFYSIGLWAVGIDVGLLIGMVAGMISFVPYLGAIVGVLAAVIAALVQHHDVLHLVLVLGVFAIGQTLEGMVLTPLLVGDRIGLHPVAVIFAVLAGGQLFGFLGILLALPVASVVMVLLRFAHERYRASTLYGQQEGAALAAADATVVAEAAVAAAEVAPAASTATAPATTDAPASETPPSR